jgi:asparagine synthase (glutamine-hydrolysing)
MCGIAGTIGPEWLMAQHQRRDVIHQMCNVISHRGPDDDGIYLKGGVALGMRRLSIIDVKGGQQPISNEDGTVWIVFNGEIYNYRELRRFLQMCGHRFRTNTDTEVVVHLYEELGERCVEKLRGMFGFAIWDARQEKLLIARDRLGKKPMHFLHAGDTLIFGSEIKSILQHPLVRREVNYEAISDYLSFGYVPDPKTAFRGIEKLPPGHTLTFQYGQVEQKRYWDFNYAPSDEPARSERDYAAELRDKIEEAVRIRLIGEVPLGAFLSGGIDSSTVVGMMTKLTPEPVKTFSIGFTEASHDELEYARVTAQRFHTDHHEFVVAPDVCRLVDEVVWHHDEPFADVSSLPTYIVSQMAREFVKVVLSGDGGDEIFAGYDRYALHQRRARFERLPAIARKNLMLPLSRALPQITPGKNFLRNIALDPAARYVDTMTMFNQQQKNALLGDRAPLWLESYDATASFIRLFNAPASTDTIDRLMYLDSKTYLPGDIMAKVDRMSMAHSIETRAPFLDHELIEFVQRIPAALKLKGDETKYILKQAVTGLVPEVIIRRQKKGFGVPLRAWFKRELKEMLHDTLTDQRTRERGLLNQRAIRHLINEHQIGRRDHARELWSLLTLELWHRAFVDQKPAMSYAGAKSVSLKPMSLAAASS